MPASICIKFILYGQNWRKLPLRISPETSFFSRQDELSALVDMALHFPQRQQSRFPFRPFSVRFVCIADELTSPPLYSHCSYCWFKVVWLEAVTQRCSTEKVLLEISQNSQENTWARVSFLLKFAGLRRATLLKLRLWHRRFPVNFVKFLRTPFLQNTSRRLVLYGFVCRK